MGMSVSTGALVVCGGYRVPIDLARMDNDCGAIVQNAQQQMAVVTKMVQVARTIEDTVKKLEPLWSAGTAAASMAGTYKQICGCMNDLNGQGGDLGKQIQSIGKLLETVNRIIQFVKGANAMCSALMSNPFSMSAAKACASATQVQTGGFLGMLTQAVNAVGQVVSAIQQSTQGTSNTMNQIGAQLGSDPGVTQPGVGSAPPMTAQPYPYPQYPGATPPFLPDQTAGQTPGGYPAYPSFPTVQTGIPSVYDSGWRPAEPSPGTTETGGAGGSVTFKITDTNGDNKPEIEATVSGGLLDSNLTVNVDGEFGGEEFKTELKINKNA